MINRHKVNESIIYNIQKSTKINNPVTVFLSEQAIKPSSTYTYTTLIHIQNLFISWDAMLSILGLLPRI
jgi:hypothetical protein